MRAPVPALDPETVRSVLAYVAVAGGGATIVAAWFIPSSASDDPMLIITPTFGVISAVLGWYFGIRGVERAEARERETSAAARAVIEEAASRTRERIARSRALELEVAGLRAFLASAGDQPALRSKLEEGRRQMED